MYNLIRTLPDVRGCPFKFLILEDGTCLVGRVEYHKHLEGANERSSKIIAAGQVPNCPIHHAVNASGWGGWESTGYKVITPSDMRETIRGYFIQNAALLGLRED